MLQVTRAYKVAYGFSNDHYTWKIDGWYEIKSGECINIGEAVSRPYEKDKYNYPMLLAFLYRRAGGENQIAKVAPVEISPRIGEFRDSHRVLCVPRPGVSGKEGFHWTWNPETDGDDESNACADPRFNKGDI